jgi:two-component system, NtrC family, nitrogen regulation sensor histidine kinase NtrY
VNFRTRLTLVFAVTVLVAVVAVEWIVSNSTGEAFERLESQRVDALAAQFRKEFVRRSAEIVRGVNGIAASEAALNIAIALNNPAPDFSPWVNEAAAQASVRGLGLLEMLGDNGTIVSSAQWPARFGYMEAWVAARSDWPQRGAFLRREELPDGEALALVAVGAAAAGDRKLFVVGGQKLDSGFLATLVLPTGMRVLLRTPQGVFDAAGPVAHTEKLGRIVHDVYQRNGERTQVVNWTGDEAGAETFHALPLRGADNEILAILLVGSSRRELVELERRLRYTGLMVAAWGVLLGIALSWWATARVTRPVQDLAEQARKVAAGDWSATAEIRSGDEIGQLARAFNRMTHELVEQRERLVQSERVAAWRELARRLAHELKNPLFPLQITVENMQRARERYPEQFDEVFNEGTATLLAELANLKQIIGRFSEFAKMPPPRLEALDLNELAAATLKFFEPQLEQARVAGRLELAPGLRTVKADPEQMGGVLRNLVLNAIDAMAQGGTVTVRTLATGTGVRIEVADTGQGLTPEECARLFTPYYTTKTHGTGLGLAIVQSVVSDHNGRISVASEPGKGATFRIDLQ